MIVAKRSLVVLLFLVQMSVTSLAAQDEASLKAAFQSVLETLSRKDLDGFLSKWHPQAVLSSRNRIHPIDKAKVEDRVWREAFQELFDKVYGIGYTMQAVDFRVVGDTGIVWGLTQLAVEPRKESGFDQQTRLAAVFIWVEGQWKILLWSDSPLPSDARPIVR